MIHFTISPFLILIEFLFFRFFRDNLNFSILSAETFGSFSRSTIASSIDVYSFTFASSAFFFIIKRGNGSACFFVKKFINLFMVFNLFY